jgi:SAM-dependent methyltransferase
MHPLALALLIMAPAHDHGSPDAHGGHPAGQHGNPEDFEQYLAHMEEPDRVRWQKPDEVLAVLKLDATKVVCDIGAGPGYFALRAARKASWVWAVDVEARMIDALKIRIEKAGARNVSPVLGLPGDPLLPRGSCDVILIVDTYHHFPDGPTYLKSLAGLLKPGGRLVNIDFKKEETPMGPPVELRVSRDAFVADAAKAGLSVAEEPAFLPYQYFLVLRPR